ncbi:MAG TPA: hypothetical protein VH142_11065 [Polyangiaceae bacterium]|jgi:hypothetical protein|nr:hypothetical protein [Polyangiaceae bacterium]
METKESVNSAREQSEHKPPRRGINAVGGSADSGADMSKAVGDVVSSVAVLYHATDVFLGRQTRERPRVVLGAAAGIGFVLGGGLASRVGGLIVTIGGRLLANRMLKDVLPGA